MGRYVSPLQTAQEFCFYVRRQTVAVLEPRRTVWPMKKAQTTPGMVTIDFRFQSQTNKIGSMYVVNKLCPQEQFYVPTKINTKNTPGKKNLEHDRDLENCPHYDCTSAPKIAMENHLSPW